MAQELEFKQACRTESYGEKSYGIQVLIAMPGYELTQADHIRVSHHAQEIIREILTERAKNDPADVARGLQMRKDLLACFPDHWIYAEEAPNGYWRSDPEAVNIPWLRVTTNRGVIIIGWRKRVIEINWNSEVGKTASELFPDEDVTKADYMIHAWGYDKAKEYLAKLLQ